MIGYTEGGKYHDEGAVICMSAISDLHFEHSAGVTVCRRVASGVSAQTCVGMTISALCFLCVL